MRQNMEKSTIFYINILLSQTKSKLNKNTKSRSFRKALEAHYGLPNRALKRDPAFCRAFDSIVKKITMVCSNCSKFMYYELQKTPFFCSCHRAIYCSLECQKEHWAEHESNCCNRDSDIIPKEKLTISSFPKRWFLSLADSSILNQDILCEIFIFATGYQRSASVGGHVVDYFVLNPKLDVFENKIAEGEEAALNHNVQIPTPRSKESWWQLEIDIHVSGMRSMLCGSIRFTETPVRRLKRDQLIEIIHGMYPKESAIFKPMNISGLSIVECKDGYERYKLQFSDCLDIRIEHADFNTLFN